MTFKHSDGVWMPGRSCYVLHLALLERYDGVVQGRGRVYRERASFPSIRLNPNGLGVAGMPRGTMSRCLHIDSASFFLLW